MDQQQFDRVFAATRQRPGNQPIKWSSAPQRTAPLQLRPQGLMALWGRESREAAEIQRQARIEGHRELAKHKLRQFKNFLMRLEAMDLIEGADELMDYAEQKAMQNPGRADIYIEATLKFIELQQRIHTINHTYS
ncbi:hypothetical protein [Mycobacteroides abscessus]|uniref:hypothetical protein n=1 Tax=Mycobacteroides abscessus TaxID=36809 RepID=UPI00092BA63C|nr:hypothetical protein [Mycobacteroides abscessus]SIC58737.1 Uncharacterised protein [Mycobacteroides abscessus subsp. abscessus]